MDSKCSAEPGVAADGSPSPVLRVDFARGPLPLNFAFAGTTAPRSFTTHAQHNEEVV
jgi:hypothetical protein